MFRFRLFAVLLILSPPLFALESESKSCVLPRDASITVGCTYHCSRWIRWGLYFRAWRSGYNVKIKNLYAPNTTPDLSQVDALLIPGGADINPHYYTAGLEKELQEKIEKLDYLVDYSYEGRNRDPFEADILQTYFSSEKLAATPLLGICRGMQMIAASRGVPLIVDIKKEIGIRNRRWTIDRIQVTNPESQIKEMLDRERFWGVEYHHQAIRLDYFNKHKERWPDMEITALSNGGRIPEVLEFYKRPVLGTQFHPEWTFGSVRRGVFDWFLNRACHKKRSEERSEAVAKN